MRAIGSVSGKIEASAAIHSEPSQMVQQGSSRRSEAHRDSKQVPWEKAPARRAFLTNCARACVRLNPIAHIPTQPRCGFFQSLGQPTTTRFATNRQVAEVGSDVRLQ